MNAETSLTTAQVVVATGGSFGVQANKRIPSGMSGGAQLFVSFYRQASLAVVACANEQTTFRPSLNPLI
jgi:hypothetical protein